MWWPAIGGLVIGMGGLDFPASARRRVRHHRRTAAGRRGANHVILGVLLVKSIIWAVSLGSGTSGGVLAPLVDDGWSAGRHRGDVSPNEGAGFWPLISMGAILGGTMRSPLTGIIFAFELTHDLNVLLPLLVASVIAHAFTVLLLKRSILTEKVARRGYHLSREYAVDPLEIQFVREVMRTNLVAFEASSTLAEVRTMLHSSTSNRPRGQHLYPIVDAERRLQGVITRKQLRKMLDDPDTRNCVDCLSKLASNAAVVAHPDEPLRVVVYRMAETGFTRFPVVERGERPKLVGMISLQDLLVARTRNLAEERARERVLRIRFGVAQAS